MSEASTGPGIRPLLVLVGGAPATGKTTLARQLSSVLAVPRLSRDTIRDIVLDALHIQSWEASKSVSIAVYDIFYELIRLLLEAGVSLIADCNFYRGVSEGSILPLIADTRARAVLIHLTTAPETSMRRFIERAHQPDRRRSAFDLDRIAQIASGEFSISPSQYEPLDLGIPTLAVDTTSDYAPEVGAIVEFIRTAGCQPTTSQPTRPVA